MIVKAIKIEKTDQICLKIEATTDQSLNFPLIPQSFIEKYVEEQGKIDEAMINMTGRDHPDYPWAKVPEVRKDNTVIVSKVKDSWIREEVFDLLHQYDLHGKCNTDEDFMKWIEENL